MTSTQNSPVRQTLLILTPFVLWLFVLKGFFLNRLSLIEDATVYYEHIKFYLDHLVHGVYPLWDPTRDFGTANEFYLRRIGSFNPLFLVIILLDKIGFSFTQAYWIFLAGYVFLGMMGFYCLLRLFWKERIWAYLGYVMLLFSSFSLRIFDSNIFLIFVPIVWFFYFLLSFARAQEKFSFLGAIFCLMMVLTTYIPFYFLTIFLWFGICTTVVYANQIPQYLQASSVFVRNNKFFTVVCLVALCFSFVPGYLMFKDGQKKDFIMPNRQDEASLVEGTGNRFSVGISRIQEGGVIPPALLDEQFSQLKEFKAGDFYVPIVLFVILGLALVNWISRLTLVTVLFGFGIFMLSLSDAVGLHAFFYRYVFFFKYFRNWHFFLWIVFIPSLIVIAIENLRIVSIRNSSRFVSKALMLVWVVVIHVALLLWLKGFEEVLPSSYMTIYLSALFFIVYIFWRQEKLFFLFGVLIIAQPVQIFSYFSQSAHSYTWYRYEDKYLLWDLYSSESRDYYKKLWEGRESIPTDNAYKSVLYSGSVWANFLHIQMPEQILYPYINAHVIAYDRVEKLDDNDVDVPSMRQSLAMLENKAFVPLSYDGPLAADGVPVDNKPLILIAPSPELQVLGESVNHLRLKVQLSRPKFLVHNNSYHDGWRVFIDGKKSELWRANIAFRGVWVPAGEHVVDFRFGRPWQYALNWFILGVFYASFVYLIKLIRQKRSLVG